MNNTELWIALEDALMSYVDSHPDVSGETISRNVACFIGSFMHQSMTAPQRKSLIDAATTLAKKMDASRGN